MDAQVQVPVSPRVMSCPIAARVLYSRGSGRYVEIRLHPTSLVHELLGQRATPIQRSRPQLVHCRGAVHCSLFSLDEKAEHRHSLEDAGVTCVYT